jgi:hypothetical protein
MNYSSKEQPQLGHGQSQPHLSDGLQMENVVTARSYGLFHNWVRSHWGLGKNQTPAMAIGYYYRPISMTELLTVQCLDLLIL